MNTLLIHLLPHWEERFREVGVRRGDLQDHIRDAREFDALHAALDSKDYALAVIGVADSIERTADICRRLRSSAGEKRVQIYVCNGSFQTYQIQLLIEAGADDYLTDSDGLDQIELRLRLAECRAAYMSDKLANIFQGHLPKLRESDVSIAEVLKNLPEVITFLDHNATICFTNRLLPSIDHDQLIGTNGFARIHPSHQQKSRELFARALSTGTTQRSDATLDIYGKKWRLCIVPLADKVGNVLAMVVSTDVTEQTLSADGIHGERQLPNEDVDSRDYDRPLTACDIPDSFVQQITASLFHIQAFEYLRESDTAKADECLKKAVRLISESIKEARRVSGGLYPFILEDYGIIEAVKYLVCEMTNHTNIGISFQHDVRFKRLSKSMDIALFHIIQEAVTNACRHSNSPTVEVRIFQYNDRLQIKVIDNGIGFNPQEISENCFGLQCIHKYARLLGGVAEIHSQPAQGTKITVEIPNVPSVDESNK